jgi:hypothetical protein
MRGASRVALRIGVGVITLAVAFVFWTVVIGWVQHLAGLVTGAPVVSDADEWHWLSLIGLITLPIGTVWLAVRALEQRLDRDGDGTP